MNRKWLISTLIIAIVAFVLLLQADSSAAEDIVIFDGQFGNGWNAWTCGAESLSTDQTLDVLTIAPESGLFLEHPQWWEKYVTLEGDDRLVFDLDRIGSSTPYLGVRLMRLDGSRTAFFDLPHSGNQKTYSIPISEFMAGEDEIYVRAILFENFNEAIVRSDFSLSNIRFDQGGTALPQPTSTPAPTQVNPTPDPNPDPEPVATQTPQPSATCGPLAQEAENGLFSGNMGASGEGIAATDGTFDYQLNPNNSVSYCVTSPDTDAYYMQARINAATDKSDSFFVSINGELFTWHAVA
ncbi:MAG: hypothetical protein AAF633_12800, partial [Chloroflexota bacterium]